MTQAPRDEEDPWKRLMKDGLLTDYGAPYVHPEHGIQKVMIPEDVFLLNDNAQVELLAEYDASRMVGASNEIKIRHCNFSCFSTIVSNHVAVMCGIEYRPDVGVKNSNSWNGSNWTSAYGIDEAYVTFKEDFYKWIRYSVDVAAMQSSEFVHWNENGKSTFEKVGDKVRTRVKLIRDYEASAGRDLKTEVFEGPDVYHPNLFYGNALPLSRVMRSARTTTWGIGYFTCRLVNASTYDEGEWRFRMSMKKFELVGFGDNWTESPKYRQFLRSYRDKLEESEHTLAVKSTQALVLSESEDEDESGPGSKSYYGYDSDPESEAISDLEAANKPEPEKSPSSGEKANTKPKDGEEEEEEKSAADLGDGHGHEAEDDVWSNLDAMSILSIE